MLQIYGTDLSSPANKVRFVANFIGLKYDYIKVNLRAGEQQKPEFLRLHPAGKVPVINDDGFIVFESNAIIKYLALKNNSPLYPKDIKEQAIVDQWIDFGSHHVGLAMSKVVYNRLFAPMRNVSIDEQSLKDGLAFLDRFLPVVDNQLGKNKFITGNKLTLADINLLAVFDPAEVSNIDLTKYKNITQWRNSLRKESFYTKCHQEYGDALAALKK